MKLVFVSIGLVLISIEAADVEVVYSDGAQQRLYFRGYNLVCPKLVRIADSYSDKERFLITFANVKFIQLGKHKELRQNHKHSRHVSSYKFQLTDSTGKIIKFNTIQPLYAKYAPFYISFDCDQTQNRLTIRISDKSKSNPINLYKQPVITHTQRELHTKKDRKAAKSTSSDSSGNTKTRRVL